MDGEPERKPPLKYSMDETLKMIDGTRYYPAICKECGSQGPSNLVMDEFWCNDDCSVSCSCCGFGVMTIVQYLVRVVGQKM